MSMGRMRQGPLVAVPFFGVVLFATFVLGQMMQPQVQRQKRNQWVRSRRVSNLQRVRNREHPFDCAPQLRRGRTIEEDLGDFDAAPAADYEMVKAKRSPVDLGDTGRA